MTHIEHLKTICELEGLQVVDVGAGDGVYSRDLYAAGAKVIAIEIDPGKVAKAKENLPKNIDVRLGAAEDLPLESGSQDLACLFFSFHHIPVEVQHNAFTEIHRVLGNSGRLHIVEPYPYGTMFEVIRLVEDETLVRSHSHETLSHLDGVDGFWLENKREYVLTREYPTFDAFLKKIVWPDPDRSRAYAKVSSDMEDTFNRSVEILDGQIVLHQPCAAYHFIVSN